MPENVSEYRYADFEYRASDDGLGTVSGTIIRYGDKASFPWGTEEIKAGAFGDVEGADLIANRMHQRTQPLARTGVGLRITDTPEQMIGEVTLPDTSVGRDTAVEVGKRILRGLSLEFRSVKDIIDEDTQHRTIEKATMFGFGVVDRPAYPGSVAQMRRWQDYMGQAETRSAYDLWTPGAAVMPPDPEPEPEPDPDQSPDGDGIRYVDFPPDLDYDDVEARQVDRMSLEGRLPYNVDGITSMSRGERVRFLPGALTDSLGGEIVLLAGNNYDDVLATTAANGALRLRDTETALIFEARRLPRTRYAEDFASKLRLGLVRGVTAGWAQAGSETTTEELPDGGSRVTVRKAMLCKVRLRTRSSYAGESITARPRRREALRFQAV